MLSMSSQTRNCIPLTAMGRRHQRNLLIVLSCTKSSCRAEFGSQLYRFTSRIRSKHECISRFLVIRGYERDGSGRCKQSNCTADGTKEQIRANTKYFRPARSGPCQNNSAYCIIDLAQIFALETLLHSIAPLVSLLVSDRWDILTTTVRKQKDRDRLS
jgi:hypothetical protein